MTSLYKSGRSGNIGPMSYKAKITYGREMFGLYMGCEHTSLPLFSLSLLQYFSDVTIHQNHLEIAGSHPGVSDSVDRSIPGTVNNIKDHLQEEKPYKFILLVCDRGRRRFAANHCHIATLFVCFLHARHFTKKPRKM